MARLLRQEPGSDEGTNLAAARFNDATIWIEIRDNSAMSWTSATGSLIRHIAVPQADGDIFATAEFEEKVTLWSIESRKKLAEIRTVLDFGGKRLALVQEHSLCLLSAARYYGPVSAYDLEGNVLWSRKDLVGVQQLSAIPNAPEPMIGVGADDQPYRILSALDGKEITQLDEVKEVYASCLTTQMLAITRRRWLSLLKLDSTSIWKRPLKSFGVLHACLSSKEVAYSEAGGAMYCFDLDGAQKWILSPKKDRHFLRVAWNQAGGRWIAIDWNYAHGGPKQLLEIGEAGASTLITNLGEPTETEFFATGDRLVTSNGDILDLQSGQVIWNY